MEVDANLDLFILFGDEHDVGYPVRLLFFSDETGVYELFNFRFNCLHYFWTKPSLMLLD